MLPIFLFHLLRWKNIAQTSIANFFQELLPNLCEPVEFDWTCLDLLKQILEEEKRINWIFFVHFLVNTEQFVVINLRNIPENEHLGIFKKSFGSNQQPFKGFQHKNDVFVAIYSMETQVYASLLVEDFKQQFYKLIHSLLCVIVDSIERCRKNPFNDVFWKIILHRYLIAYDVNYHQVILPSKKMGCVFWQFLDLIRFF